MIAELAEQRQHKRDARDIRRKEQLVAQVLGDMEGAGQGVMRTGSTVRDKAGNAYYRPSLYEIREYCSLIRRVRRRVFRQRLPV